MSCCSKPKVFEHKNGKVLHEFNCSNCSGFITVKLDEDLNGAHCVICPSCSHEHYRIIKDGVITEDRAPSSSKTYAIKIRPTMAAFSRTSWESRMAGRTTKAGEEGKHFLNDAWKKMTGRQKQTPPEKRVEKTAVEKVENAPIQEPSPCSSKKVVNEIKDKAPIPEPSKAEPVLPYQSKVAIEELIHFAKKNKEAAVSLENYEDAVIWRAFEKEFITRRGK